MVEPLEDRTPTSTAAVTRVVRAAGGDITFREFGSDTVAHGRGQRVDPSPRDFAPLLHRHTCGREAAAEYQARVRLPRVDREPKVSPGVIRAQLRAVHRWGAQSLPTRAAGVERTLTFHGDADVLVPVENARSLRAVFPDIEIVTVPDAGHGVLSQSRSAATDRIRAFLRD